MTAVVFPQEAVVEYVRRLLVIVAEGTRDTSTLTRQIASLMGDGKHGRVMGTLRKYANERKQFGADEVRLIVADMETFMDPKIVEQKKEAEARVVAREKEKREKDAEEHKAAWERGGHSFNHAIAQLRADAHSLIYIAKAIEDGGEESVIDAMSDWVYSTERERLFAGLLEALKPPPEVSSSPAKRCSRRRPNGKDDKVVRLFNET